MTPLPGFLGIALALTGLRIVGSLRDRGEAVLLHHLACNRVDLHFRHHVDLPGFHQPCRSVSIPAASSGNCRTESLVPYAATDNFRTSLEIARFHLRSP